MWQALAAAGLGALGSIGGGLIGASASSKSNRLAIQFAREQAQNKYQWAVKDMEKAGLNPKLAGVQAASIGTAGNPSLRDPGTHLSAGLVQAANIAANGVLTASAANKNAAEAAYASEQAKTQSSARRNLDAQTGAIAVDNALKDAQRLLAIANAATTREQKAYYERLARRTAYEALSAGARADLEILRSRKLLDLYERHPSLLYLREFSGSARDWSSAFRNLTFRGVGRGVIGRDRHAEDNISDGADDSN